MRKLLPVPQPRLTFDVAPTAVLRRLARKKAGVGMATLFSVMLVAARLCRLVVPLTVRFCRLVAPFAVRPFEVVLPNLSTDHG